MSLDTVIYYFSHVRVMATMVDIGSSREAICRCFPLGTPEAPDQLLPTHLDTGMTVTSNSWTELRRTVEEALTRDHGEILSMKGLWRND